MSAETYHGGRTLETPHQPEAYPGVRVVAIGAWPVCLMTLSDGQTIVARGGERVHPYETQEGGRAAGFELKPGDRATVVRSDLPAYLVEWRVERAR